MQQFTPKRCTVAPQWCPYWESYLQDIATQLDHSAHPDSYTCLTTRSGDCGSFQDHSLVLYLSLKSALCTMMRYTNHKLKPQRIDVPVD